MKDCPVAWSWGGVQKIKIDSDHWNRLIVDDLRNDLIDDGRHEKPIRANILAAYKKVVAESRPGDAIFLHYSGHGKCV